MNELKKIDLEKWIRPEKLKITHALETVVFQRRFLVGYALD